MVDGLRMENLVVLHALSEVKGLGPAVLVEIGDEIVVVIDHRRVAGLARLHVAACRLVVEVQVFVDRTVHPTAGSLVRIEPINCLLLHNAPL